MLLLRKRHRAEFGMVGSGCVGASQLGSCKKERALIGLDSLERNGVDTFTKIHKKLPNL